nr:uncharacterized protein LOC123572391 [Macaca fascicularis]
MRLANSELRSFASNGGRRQQNARGYRTPGEGVPPCPGQPHRRPSGGFTVPARHRWRGPSRSRENRGTLEPSGRERLVPSLRDSSQREESVRRPRRPARPASGSRGAGSWPVLQRWGRAAAPGSRGPTSVFPSVRPSGRLARSSARGLGARNSKEAARWDGGSGLRWDRRRGAGSLPSVSAGHHRLSARLGFLHYCFRPQQRRPPRAWPRPLPPAPSREGCGEGGAAAGTTARSQGCYGPAPPLLHRRRTFASSSPVIPCVLAGVSYRSLERSSSHPPRRVS